MKRYTLYGLFGLFMGSPPGLAAVPMEAPFRCDKRARAGSVNHVPRAQL